MSLNFISNFKDVPVFSYSKNINDEDPLNYYNVEEDLILVDNNHLHEYNG